MANLLLGAVIESFSDTSSETIGRSQHNDSTPNNLAGTTPKSFEYDQDNTGSKRKPSDKRPRKGHTKSRKGCYNCKRARIKCKENRPSCDYCAHRNMQCRWPDPVQLQPPAEEVQIRSITRNANFPVQTPIAPEIQVVGPVYNAFDFKLFHHFIDKAHPHHPIGSDAVWRHDIPVISSDHEYLLHAMLALSAQDMASVNADPVTSQQLKTKAMSHRVTAISALNTAITKGLSRFEQGNAMLATCFALLFQSVYMDDGLAEYMTFIRGTVAVGIQMGIRKDKILFEHLFDDNGEKLVDPAMMKAPLVDSSLVRMALASLEKIQPLCDHVVEVEIYGMLLAAARALITSSRDAWHELRKIYAHFSYFMPQSSFNHLINPANRTCQILQSHFIALQLVMTPITQNEHLDNGDPTKEIRENSGTTGRWFRPLHRNVPDDMLEYYKWPMWVEKEVMGGRVFDGVVRKEDENGEVIDGVVPCFGEWPAKNRGGQIDSRTGVEKVVEDVPCSEIGEIFVDLIFKRFEIAD
ncbi:Zn2/Cys6 DNA-binding protein [Glarea lozoyensis ATCC 20868]|uniref:Zn2/Cys6 DNA-binding protein n=1 Tax=Glarea lozoyensis (strain ATCC 20868 / MF5171) TaxID=1116229 RepID=S3DHE1_GLAL2|nr:Zn2/Cys6 DNA-binding protein [Glarea lozoyensis ATCC 20868]EPE36574.1 Zn2/Cys6 DNA-binding protein [Glarea lozoyensis ATCC 20868]